MKLSNPINNLNFGFEFSDHELGKPKYVLSCEGASILLKYCSIDNSYIIICMQNVQLIPVLYNEFKFN